MKFIEIYVKIFAMRLCLFKTKEGNHNFLIVNRIKFRNIKPLSMQSQNGKTEFIKSFFFFLMELI